MNPESTTKLYTAPRTELSQNQGRFRIHFNFPGHNHPDHDDHSYGPLATVVESFMDPETLISMTGWDTYFYVFEGTVTANDTPFDETESGLLVDGEGMTVTAETDTLPVAFLINPDAPNHPSGDDRSLRRFTIDQTALSLICLRRTTATMPAVYPTVTMPKPSAVNNSWTSTRTHTN